MNPGSQTSIFSTVANARKPRRVDLSFMWRDASWTRRADGVAVSQKHGVIPLPIDSTERIFRSGTIRHAED